MECGIIRKLQVHDPMLGPTLIRHQVVEVCQPCEKRLLTATWVMEPFHREEFPLDGVMGLI